MNYTQEELVQAVKTLAQQNANLNIDNALLKAKLDSAYNTIESLTKEEE